jgi:hypothetical protein
MTETHTYPDGSQRVGCPPFPVLSPLEEQNQRLRGPVPEKEPEPESPRRGRPPKVKAE